MRVRISSALAGVLFILLWVLSGCSVDPATRLPGIWSNGEQGKVLDVTPNGLYAEVWLESDAQLNAWQISDDQVVLAPLCTALASEPRSLPFIFDDEGLTFPAKDGRYTRFIQEPRNAAPDTRLVGLWSRDTKSRKTELIEFTPWGTAIWNRWRGEAGKEKLVAGWASLSKGKEGGLLFSGVEDGKLLSWIQPVGVEASASKITLTFPAEIGEKTFLKADPSQAQKAAKAPTR